MATLTLRVEDNFFVETRGVQSVYIKKPTHVVANGWDCVIADNGTIECNSTKEYSNGLYNMRYKILPNGFAKLTLKTPNNGVKTIMKGFVIPKGEKLCNGLIGLSSGKIDKRYAYFRNEEFQNFLKDHEISAIKHEDPNRVYLVRNARYAGGDCISYIKTDGEMKVITTREREEQIEVTGATWVLHRQSQHEGDCHNCFGILYTIEKDPTNLVGIPNIKEIINKRSKINLIGDKGFINIEELEQELKKIVPTLKRDNVGYEFRKEPYIVFYKLNNSKIELNNGTSITFLNEIDAKKAFEEFKGVRYKNIKELEEALKNKYIIKLAKYYASCEINKDKTELYVLMRRDDNNTYHNCFWTAKVS